MYIYLNKLLQSVAEHISVQIFNIGPEQIISDVKLLPENNRNKEELRNDVLYVCRFQQLRTFRTMADSAPIICVLEPGVTVEPIFFAEKNAAVVSGCSVKEFLLILTRALYSIGQNTYALAEDAFIFSNCSTLDEFATAAYSVLTNPIIITDANQRKLAYTDPILVSDDVYESLIAAQKYIAVRSNPPAGNHYIDWTYLRISGAEEPLNDYPRIFCSSLAVKSKLVGYLHIVEVNHPITKKDFAAIDLLSNLLGIELWRQSVHEKQEYSVENILRELLDTSVSERSEELAQRIHKELNYALNRFVIVLTPAKNSPVLPVPLYDLTKEFSDRIPNSLGFFYHNSIILLAATQEKTVSLRELISLIENHASKYHLKIGVSNSFLQITRLRYHVWQAKKAIEIGSRVDCGNTIFFYQDYSIFHLIELGVPKENADAFCAHELLKLSREATQGSQDLLKTLKAYLKCGCSKVKTAEKMFLHLSTIKYRISHLEQLLDVDFDDGDQIFNIMLSLKLLEYQELL